MVKIRKILNITVGSLIVASPLATVSCKFLFGTKGDYPENYYNDFAISRLDSEVVLNIHDQWGKEWMNDLKSKGFDDINADRDGNYNQSFDTISKGSNKFGDSFVQNILSWNNNQVGRSSQELNEDIRVQESVSMVTDTDSALMSIVAGEGYLKDISEFDVSSVNTDVNQYLFDIAIDNSSMEVNGVREQIGIPYSFQHQGIVLGWEMQQSFESLFNQGSLNHITMAGARITDVINTSSSDPHKIFVEYVQDNGWTWNEMITLGDTMMDLLYESTSQYDRFKLFSDFGGMRLEGFLSAKRYNSVGELMWNGISDDWNSDVIDTLASQNSITESEVNDILLNTMDLLAPSSDVERGIVTGYDPVYLTSTTISGDALPMPLFTNNGNDIYDDFVINSNSLFLPDDQQFFSSEKGVDFREEAIELFVQQQHDGQAIDGYEYSYVSPYTTTNWIASNKGSNKYTNDLIDIMLSNDTDYSVSSTRWLGDWFRKTLENSVTWNDGSYWFRSYDIEFKPLDSVDREKDLYGKYDLKIK